MSFLNGIMKLGTKAVNFTKAGVVKTSEVAAGKIKVGNMNLEGLLRSPQADEFIASAGKQNATILSDNIVRFAVHWCKMGYIDFIWRTIPQRSFSDENNVSSLLYKLYI